MHASKWHYYLQTLLNFAHNANLFISIACIGLSLVYIEYLICPAIVQCPDKLDTSFPEDN